MWRRVYFGKAYAGVKLIVLGHRFNRRRGWSDADRYTFTRSLLPRTFVVYSTCDWHDSCSGAHTAPKARLRDSNCGFGAMMWRGIDGSIFC